MDPSSYYSSNFLNSHVINMYSVQSNTLAPQAQIYNYGVRVFPSAYDNSPSAAQGYHGHFTGIDAANAESMGNYGGRNYGGNQPPMHHTGYGYNIQVPYQQYPPVTTPLSSSEIPQFYYPNNFFPSVQQWFPSNGPYLCTSPAPLADLTMPVERQDSARALEGTVSILQTASQEPIGPVGPFRQGISSPSAMVSQQQTPFPGLGSSINSDNQGSFHDGRHQHGNNFRSPTYRMTNDDHSLMATDQGRLRGQGNASAHSFRDYSNEQNRGPRATRRRNINKNSNIPGVDHELFNMPDFNIDYKDAKFFIIKSYNEENIHKSIKYGVWSTTVCGNNTLDAAYSAAKRKVEPCPVFLFFSVNASAQFCGVAEMIGCVDFDLSVDYWQQDSWSGVFPVKWHIIKDVPNFMFRHIILESNDNKPVTKSRNTQEVKLEYGLEMLGIFKKYETDVSILNEFEFYEEMEKAQQESQSRRSPPQQQHLEEMHQLSNVASAISLTEADGQVNPAPMHNELVDQTTRNSAEVVPLGKVDKDCGSSDISNSATRSEEDSNTK